MKHNNPPVWTNTRDGAGTRLGPFAVAGNLHWPHEQKQPALLHGRTSECFRAEAAH